MSRILILCLLAGLSACNGFTPMPIPESGNIPKGPGLFTGSAGAFVIGVPAREPSTSPNGSIPLKPAS